MAEESVESPLFESVWETALRRVSDRAAATVELLEENLRALGPIHRRDQELWAGDRLLNDDRNLLPRLSRATSLGLAVYLGNRRIAAWSVLDAGEAQAVGGYADAVVVEAVLRRREVFRGTLERGGREHIVACRPIYARDRSDEYGPLGILEAYQDRDTYREMIANSLRAGGGDPRASMMRQGEQLEGFVQFIDDVARRLQLLALNGNIIAAQAGDHGRAFRVVCRELSNLAEQSKDTVAEVRKLTERAERPEPNPPAEGA